MALMQRAQTTLRRVIESRVLQVVATEKEAVALKIGGEKDLLEKFTEE
jgi:hypothetical protein